MCVAVGAALLFLCKTWASTIVVSKCSDGIIIGSDSLAVSGPLIRNRVAQNVYDLDGADSVVCCCSSTSGQSDFHHLLTDLRRLVRSSYEDEDLFMAVGSGWDDGSGRKARKMSASALARYARRLVTKKYRKAHIIIAGADFNDATDAGAGGASASMPLARGSPCQYSIHEIVDGGSHIVHADFVVAGTGSDLVHALLANLLDSCSSSGSGSSDGGKAEISPDLCARTVKQALKSAATVDPRTGAALRLWLFAAGKGLKRIEVV